MAAINEVRVSSAQIPPAIVELARREFAHAFWEWFRLNQNRRLFKIKVWFISKSVYVRDLHDVFEMLFGPEPSA
jgi:hypothetical protein